MVGRSSSEREACRKTEGRIPLREMTEKPEESQGALSDCNWTAKRKAKLCRGSRMKRDTTMPSTILLLGRQATLKLRSTEHHGSNWDCNRECNFYAFRCCIKFAYVLSEKRSFQSIINSVHNRDISLYLKLLMKERIFIIISNNYIIVWHIKTFK